MWLALLASLRSWVAAQTPNTGPEQLQLQGACMTVLDTAIATLQENVPYGLRTYEARLLSNFDKFDVLTQSISIFSIIRGNIA